LADLKTLASPAVGKINKIYIHWAAGRYDREFTNYHFLVDAGGTIYATVTDVTTRLNHTYMRNTGAVAIGAMCAYDATTVNFGNFPPTEAQIEAIARTVAVLAEALNLPIDIQHVMTHAEAADNKDGVYPPYVANGYPNGMYGPEHSCEHWDFWMLKPEQARGGGGDILRAKATWYHLHREDLI